MVLDYLLDVVLVNPIFIIYVNCLLKLTNCKSHTVGDGVGELVGLGVGEFVGTGVGLSVGDGVGESYIFILKIII